jgi:hypothetical protein
MLVQKKDKRSVRKKNIILLKKNKEDLKKMQKKIRD